MGGGVPVEHSRQMARKLNHAGIANTFIEVPKTGHACRTPALWDETVPWLLEQKRVENPDRITLVVHTLRHNRSHWVAVEQQIHYGEPSTVDARYDRAAAKLLESLDGPPDSDVEATWAIEIERRVREVLEGKAETEEWSVVRERIRKEL